MKEKERGEKKHKDKEKVKRHRFLWITIPVISETMNCYCQERVKTIVTNCNCSHRTATTEKKPTHISYMPSITS